MQVDNPSSETKSTSTTLQSPESPAPTKRRNRETAGLPAAEPEVVDIKKPKLAEEVTEFEDDF
jgi:hypothetical protein